MLRRQQVRVGAARIDPGQQQVAALLDGELAGLRGPGREADPVAHHLAIVGTGQVPHRLEVLGVEALAVGNLGIPVRAQLAPGAGEVGGLDLGERLPRPEDAAGCRVRRRARVGFVHALRLGRVFRAVGLTRLRLQRRQQLVAHGFRGRAPRLGEQAADVGLQRGKRVPVRLQDGLRIDGAHRRPRAVHRAEERVVVLLADRVELVVVAAGARHGQPKERLRRHVHLVVRPLDAILPGIDRLEAVLDEPEVGRTDHRLVGSAVRGEARVRQQVPGQVLADQLVVGDVVVEGADQVVAVAPGERDVGVPPRCRAIRCSGTDPSSGAPHRSPKWGDSMKRSTRSA